MSKPRNKKIVKHIKPKNLLKGSKDPKPQEIQSVWISKAIERRDEIRSGQVKAIPGEQVINEVSRLVGR